MPLHHRVQKAGRVRWFLASIIVLTPIAPTVAQTYTCSWANAASGNWSASSDWTGCSSYYPNNGTPAGNTYSATIGATGSTYTVTLSGPIALDALTVNSGSATLDLGANKLTTNVSGGVALQAGTVSNGTIQADVGTTAVSIAANSSGTLDGVTLNGSLDVTGSSSATIKNGITLNGTGGTGVGTINLGTDGTYGNNLDIAPTTTTLGNVDINMGQSGSTGSSNEILVGYGGTGTLTLANTVNLQDTGSGGTDFIGNSSQATLVNDGTIGVSGTRTLYIYPTTFTNGATGTLTANTGATLDVNSTTFTNDSGGTLTADAGATLDVSPTTLTNNGTVTGLDGSTVDLTGAVTNAGVVNIGTATSTAAATTLQFGTAGTSSASTATAWTNTGTINVENASLYLGGSFTTGGVGTIKYSGTNALYLNGYLDNSAATLNLASGTFAGLVMRGGTIHGGVIQGGSANLFTGANSSGTLDGVTLNGSLDITGGNATALIANGITLNGTGGTGVGTINLGTDGTYGNNLDIAPTTTTLGNVDINMGQSGSTGSSNEILVGYGGTGTLTLANTVNLQDTGSGGTDFIGNSSQATLVNDGTIGVSGTRTLYIYPTTFTNGATGTLTANTGATLDVNSTTFTNDSGGTLTADAGATLDVSPTTLTNNGTVTGLDGSTVDLTGAVTNAGVVNIGTATSTAAATTLQFGTAGTSSASTATAWTNTGTINVENASLYLGGSFTTGGVGTIKYSGTNALYLNGYLDNSAATLNLASGTFAGLVMRGGTIHGGVIQGGSANLFTGANSYGTLDGVTLNGSLDVTGGGSRATIANGITLNGTGGTGVGTINLGTDGTYGNNLDIAPTTTTLGNVDINMGQSGSTGSSNEILVGYGGTGTLTLANTVNLQDTGSGGTDYIGNSSQATLVNDGTIGVSGTRTLYIYPTTFTNGSTGTLTANTGATLDVNSTTFTNDSGGTLTADAGATLDVSPTTLTNDGTVTGLDGSTVDLTGAVTNAGVVNIGTATSTAAATTLQFGTAGTSSASTATAWTNTGTINVENASLYLGGSFTTGGVGTIKYSGTNALYLNGYLDNSAATLNLASGTFAGLVMRGGTIHGGVIQGGSANLFTGANSYGTLDGVTLNGSLDVTGGGSRATIANGITLNGTGGTGVGTINLGTDGTYGNNLDIAPTTTTLGNVDINMGQSGSTGSSNEILVGYGGTGTLTLANTVNLQDTGSGGTDYIGNSSQATLVNDGTIGVSGTRTLYIYPTTFTNGSTGTLTANTGATLDVNSTTFTNDSGGTLTADAGATLDVSPTTLTNDGTVTGLDGSTVDLTGAVTNAGVVNIGTATSTAAATTLQFGTAGTSSASTATAWTNTGTINVENASLYLGGSFTTGGVGTINYSGTNALYLNGYLDNSGATLNLASGTFAGLVMRGGTIHGGVIQGGSANLFTGANSYGTLDGVTLNGSLDVTGGGSRATIANGITLNGTGGTGVGTINLGTDGTYGNNLDIAPTTTTLGNVDINMGQSGSTGSSNEILVGYGGTGTLTLANTVNLQDTGSGGTDFIGNSSQATLVNDGTIGVSGTRTLYINPTTFTNGATGTLTANTGATLDVNPTTFTNLVGGTLTGGSYQANGGGAINIYGVPTVTLAASVTLNGTGSTFESYDTSKGTYTPIDASLTTIGPSGTLAVLGNRNYTTTNAITNQGTLQIGGGTFSSASLANNGTLTGFGTVTPAIANTGSVVANGGTLSAAAGVQGATGRVTSDAGATLALGAGSTAGTLVNNGSLALGSNNITVSGDYQNASFGTGNGFNNHANVTGTGQILASGNSALSVTGTNGTVFTGSGDNLTLAVATHAGSVGATTATFDIGNTGSTGPVLRGAILTSAGVTASSPSFGPIALGANVGDSVTISQATAGALTSQSFRVVSNFDNVAPVIVTVSGAAYNLASGSTADVVLGAQRVGGTDTGSLVVSNTAPSGSYTEVLNAAFGGTTGDVNSTNGSISGGAGAGGVAGGASNATAMTVGLDTASSGAKSGTVTVNYVSNGTGTSGLGNTNVGSQVVNVSGNVYQAAAGSIVTPTLNFGTVQVGQSVSQNLTIANTATGAAGYVEDLNAAFGSSSDSRITGTGSLNGIVAGTNSTGANGTMTVSVNTSAAGNINGTIGVNFLTAGTVGGVSDGLGTAAVGSANYGVVGTIGANVVNDASPVINNSPINLGNVRVGGAFGTAFVSLSNQATTSPQAALDASITGNAPITASGSVSLLAPGATDTTHLQVGIANSATASAGAIDGTATLALTSDAGNIGKCAPNCTLTLASQNVTVTGGVYQVAQPTIASAVNLGNVHVGGTASGVIGVTNTNVAPTGYQEGLDATVASTSGATASGTITNLAAGSTSHAIGTSLAVGGAGVQSGTVTLALASDGTGTSGLGTLALANQAVTVEATGYNLASGSTADVVLGAQRVGGTDTGSLVVSNTAPSGSYTEVLNATTGAMTGDVNSVSGSISGGAGAGGVAGGASNATAMTVGLNTASSGAKSGTVTLDYVSNGTGTSGLGNTNVGSQVVNVSGNVYQAAAGSIVTPTLNFGTVQVGQSVSQNLTIANTATGAAGYVEDLNAAFGSSSDSRITGTGSLNGIVAGTNSTGANGTMTVSVNTSAAGNINGTIGVNFLTAGTVGGVSDGLGTAAVGSANYGVVGTIGANVVNDASPVINNSPINLGNVRVGGAFGTAFVSLSNQATTSPQAALDASITGNAPITASGSVSLLAPGATDTTHLQVGIANSATASAGAIDGTATLALTSDAGNIGKCAPNCTLTLASQNVTVTGGVYQVAQPTIASAVNLGNVHVGGTASGVIGVTNTNVAPTGYQEGLDATVASTSGATASGTITNLAAGSTSHAIGTSLAVGGAGVQSGTVTLALASDGTGTSGLGTLALANQAVTVEATGYNLASGSTADVVLGAQRVGGTDTGSLVVSNTAPSGSYTEVLNAAFGGTTGDVNSTNGSISGGAGAGGVAGGASNATAMTVGLDTASSGAKSGTVTLDYVSNGTGTSGLGNTSLGSQVVNVSGNVYQAAVAQLNTATPVNFGIVHVGDTVATQAISVTNAAAGALNDTLLASAGGASGPFTAAGNLGAAGLAAGSTDASSLTVGMTTAHAGVFNGTATFNAASHDGELADLNLSPLQVALTGIVNNYANPVFHLGSGAAGALSNSGLNYTLNLGNLIQGSGSFSDALSVLNDVTGPSDLLSGTFSLSGLNALAGLSFNGFDFGSQAFSGLGAGGSYGLSLGFDPTQMGLGGFSDTVTLAARGYNASGFAQQFGLQLTLDGTVVSSMPPTVPEPGSLALMLLGLGLVGGMYARRMGGERC